MTLLTPSNPLGCVDVCAARFLRTQVPVLELLSINNAIGPNSNKPCFDSTVHEDSWAEQMQN
jgi:hypothetical protein